LAATQNPGHTTRPGGLVRPGIAAAPLPSVEMDPRTAYDFLTSACGMCGDLTDLLPEDRTWITESRAQIRADLEPGSPAAGCLDIVTEVGRMLVLEPGVRTARDVVRRIDALPDRDLLNVLLGELAESEDYGAITLKALAGDAAAFEDLKGQLHAQKGESVLPGTLADVAPGTRRALRAWLPFYEKVEERVGRMLAKDVEGRLSEDPTVDPIGFIERTTNGVRLLPERAIRRVVLAPSYFGRPYNALTRVGDTQLVCYPISDTSLGAASRTTPPVSTIRLYRALGDETRLKILRLLADQDRYLTELATQLDLSKPTISHHLAQLRSAGLVTTTEQGNLTYYSLRRDRIAEAGPELTSFLAR
jgi:DNA-binding transcriptional ArsR family regulator